MTKIRLSRLGCLLLLLASYLYAAAPAFARFDPPPGYYPTPAAPANPPAQPAVIHDAVSVWSYALIVGLTVVGTLIVVGLVARLRRPAVRHAEQPIRALAASGGPVR